MELAVISETEEGKLTLGLASCLIFSISSSDMTS